MVVVLSLGDLWSHRHGSAEHPLCTLVAGAVISKPRHLFPGNHSSNPVASVTKKGHAFRLEAVYRVRVATGDTHMSPT